ncbi:MAG: DUF4388 domain-containing protein [Acidobacteriota bacterium]
MDFSGRLGAFPMSELLQWAKNERRTGSLVIRRSSRKKRIFFHNGNVVGCVSDDPADFFGQNLLLRGLLDEKQLVEALGRCTKTGRRLGETLVELGILDEERVRDALAEQIADAVCGIFLWSHGVFYFENGEQPPEALLPRPIETMGLVLEGSRWIDEMRRVRRIVPHDNVVLRRGPAWPGKALDSVEERVLSAVDGNRSLAVVHRMIKGTYFRVVDAAYRLCLKEVLDLGEVGDALESASVEINVYDLLLEQALEEQSEEIEGRGAPIPWPLLSELRLVWLTEPRAEELSELSRPLQLAASSFDGESTLAQWYDGDRGEEEQDFLLEQLAKGRIALLPKAPGALEEEAQIAPKGWLKRWLKGR